MMTTELLVPTKAGRSAKPNLDKHGITVIHELFGSPNNADSAILLRGAEHETGDPRSFDRPRWLNDTESSFTQLARLTRSLPAEHSAIGQILEGLEFVGKGLDINLETGPDGESPVRTIGLGRPREGVRLSNPALAVVGLLGRLELSKDDTLIDLYPGDVAFVNGGATLRANGANDSEQALGLLVTGVPA
jgi:hypothetical protein